MTDISDIEKELYTALSAAGPCAAGEFCMKAMPGLADSLTRFHCRIVAEEAIADCQKNLAAGQIRSAKGLGAIAMRALDKVDEDIDDRALLTQFRDNLTTLLDYGVADAAADAVTDAADAVADAADAAADVAADAATDDADAADDDNINDNVDLDSPAPPLVIVEDVSDSEEQPASPPVSPPASPPVRPKKKKSSVGGANRRRNAAGGD